MSIGNENPVLSPDLGANAPLPPHDEIEQLRQRVKVLEDERARDRQLVESLTAERDAYRRAAMAWALADVTDEDIERYAQNEDGIPLEAFIGELEEAVRQCKNRSCSSQQSCRVVLTRLLAGIGRGVIPACTFWAGNLIIGRQCGRALRGRLIRWAYWEAC